MYRNKTARQHNFAIIPAAEIPRSKMRMPQTKKLAFNASELIPIMCEEVLPGDTWQHQESIFARLATPIAPLVDDLDLETWYFFVPNRLYDGSTYNNQDNYELGSWERLITGTDPTLQAPLTSPAEAAGPTWPVPVGSVWDYLGIPPAAYTAKPEILAYPVWAYFLVHNEWFRDQNLQQPWYWDVGDWDGITKPSSPTTVVWDGMPLRVNKRHDYITSSLPWPQKGDAVELPLGTTAPVIGISGETPSFQALIGGANLGQLTAAAGTGAAAFAVPPGVLAAAAWNNTALEADLSAATAATINSIRLAFQTQRLLERDARGGSRYVEQLMSHFGVRSPDYRLQRPEYLGGSKIPITVNPIAQTAAYDAEPADAASPVGNLGAEMHAAGSKRTFTYAATEHGYILGYCAVRATPTYQQGVRRHFTRRTRLDWYFPVFSHLGEQAVNTTEIYFPVDTTPANTTWGYQERNAEYRYIPNEISGVLRSTVAQPLDWWHLAEEFSNEPTLSDEFIQDKTQETLSRALATYPTAQWSAQIIMDIRHDNVVARLMPTYSVPGMIDHF